MSRFRKKRVVPEMTETDTWLNSNFTYVLDENRPFGKWTDDLVSVLREMRTQQLFSVQAMNNNSEISSNDHVFALMFDFEEEEEEGIPHIHLKIDPVDIHPDSVVTVKGKNVRELAKRLDSHVMTAILSEPTQMDDVEYDPKRPLIGLWTAQQLIAQKTRRGYATILVGPKRHPIIKEMRKSRKIYTVPHDIDGLPPIVYYRGRVNVDTTVIFSPMSLKKTKEGMEMTFAMVMWKENMIKIVKGEPSEDPDPGRFRGEDQVVL